MLTHRYNKIKQLIRDKLRVIQTKLFGIYTGNNTKALQQLNVAEHQLESLIGPESVENEWEEEEREEGPGEYEDEPGDIDKNDV